MDKSYNFQRETFITPQIKWKSGFYQGIVRYNITFLSFQERNVKDLLKVSKSQKMGGLRPENVTPKNLTF